jgi:hypothetical protein
LPIIHLALKIIASCLVIKLTILFKFSELIEIYSRNEKISYNIGPNRRRK